MIYQANDLLAKLKTLVLVGQNEEGELEFIGDNNQWAKADFPDYGDKVNDELLDR